MKEWEEGRKEKKNFAFDCDTARAKLHSFDGIFDLEQPALRTPSRRVVIVLVTKHFSRKIFFIAFLSFIKECSQPKTLNQVSSSYLFIADIKENMSD